MYKDFYYVAQMIKHADGSTQLDMCKNCAELFLETHCTLEAMVSYSYLLELINDKLK